MSAYIVLCNSQYRCFVILAPFKFKAKRKEPLDIFLSLEWTESMRRQQAVRLFYGCQSSRQQIKHWFNIHFVSAAPQSTTSRLDYPPPPRRVSYHAS